MSRSRKKRPFCGITCSDSEKWDKRIANRKLRRINKERIRKAVDPDDILPLKKRDVSEIWVFAKDGKHYVKPEDIKRFPDIMRK